MQFFTCDELIGYEVHSTWKDIVELFWLKSKEERKKFVHEIDPWKIINVSPDLAIANSVRYQGGLLGKRFQALIHDIFMYGVKNPVIVHDLPKHHPHWGSREKYVTDRYFVTHGGHRVVACQILSKKVPALILHYVGEIKNA